MNRPVSIEEDWQSFALQCIPFEESHENREKAKVAFFAGYACLSRQIAKLLERSPTNAEQLAFLANIRAQTEAFLHARRKESP